MLTNSGLAQSFLPLAHKLDEGAYGVRVEGNYFDTLGHFDGEGNEIALNEGESFNKMDVDLSIIYGPTAQIDLFVKGRYRQVQSTSSQLDLSNSGPESAGGGIRYLLAQTAPWKILLQASFSQTLYSNSTYSTAAEVPAEIILGDDGLDLSFGVRATRQSSSLWALNMGIDFALPANGLSSELRYQAELHGLLKHFGIFVGLEGVQAMGGDEYSSHPSDKPLMATQSTYLFNSLDRSWNSAIGGLSFKFSAVHLRLWGGVTGWGQSTDKGNQFGFSLYWDNSSGKYGAKVKNAFKEYSIEGRVIKILAQKNFFVADIGMAQDVERGMFFDIYKTDYLGGNILVAIGVVSEVSADRCVVKIQRKLKGVEIEKNFVVRAK